MKFSDTSVSTGVGHGTCHASFLRLPWRWSHLHPHIFKFSTVSTDCHPLFFLVLYRTTLEIAIFYSTVVTIHVSTPVEPCFVHETQIVQHMNSFIHKIMKQMSVAAVAQAWGWCTDWNQNSHSFSCLVNWWQLVLEGLPLDNILRYLHGDCVSVSSTLCTLSCVKCGTILTCFLLPILSVLLNFSISLNVILFGTSLSGCTWWNASQPTVKDLVMKRCSRMNTGSSCEKTILSITELPCNW